MLKIAVIGAGLIGKKHIDIIDGLPQFKLVAVVNPDSDSESLAAYYGVKRFKSHDVLLKNCKIDCAVVASPTPSHYEIAADLLNSEIPVLIEKPITETIEEGMKLDKISNEKKTPVLGGHHRRYNPVLKDLLGVIKSKELGDIIAFSGVWSVYKPDPYYEVHWRVGPSGGPVLINLIHEIDSMQYVLGPIVEVSVLEGRRKRNHNHEEAIAVSLKFHDGVVGSITMSDSASSPWSWEQATGENNPVFPKNEENPYRFLFQGGAVEFPNIKVWGQSSRDWTQPIVLKNDIINEYQNLDVFTRQLEHFAEVVRRQAEPQVTVRECVSALQVAQLVRQIINDGGGASRVPELHWVN